MYNLPDLVMESIYEYLSYHDLLNLRSTCKKLKHLIDQKKFQRLYLFVERNHSYRDLFYTNESICYPNSFRTNNLSILNSFKFKNNFNQLQKLIVNGICRGIVNLNQLNNFTQLHHFEMNHVFNIEGKLSLNNLQIASFDYWYRKNDHFFELDCPNLKALRIVNESKPKLIGDTNNLKYLCFDSKDPVPHHSNEYLFNLYSSLQNLSTICFSYHGLLNHLLTEINRDRLNLRSLKRIELKKFFKFFLIGNDEIYCIMTEVISNLSVFTKCPSTKHIQIFINNQLSNLKDFQAVIDGIIKSQPEKLHIHYDLLKSSFQNLNALECYLPEIKRLEINSGLELDEKMFKKMKNLIIISFGKKLEKSTFEQFLKIRPRSFTYLEFNELNFESNELDQLPNYFPYLINLRLPKDFKPDCFDFISKFKNLEYLSIQQVQPERQVLTDIFSNCLDLRSILVHAKHQNIQFLRDLNYGCESNFRIYQFNRGLKSKMLHFDTLNSVFDYYYEKNLFDSELIE